MKSRWVFLLLFGWLLTIPAAEAEVLLLPGSVCVEGIEVLSDQDGVMVFQKDGQVYQVDVDRIIDVSRNKPGRYRTLDRADYPDFIAAQTPAEGESIQAAAEQDQPANAASAGLVPGEPASGAPFLGEADSITPPAEPKTGNSIGGIDTTRKIVIYLRDGNSLVGYVRRWNENDLVMQTEDGEVVIPAGQVQDAVYASPKSQTSLVRRQAAETGPAFAPGDFILSFQGGIYQYPVSELLDLEKQINPISGWAMYGDGTVKWSEMTHASYMCGGVLEHIGWTNLGVVAGFDYYTLGQKVAVGGGGYEEKVFAEGDLMVLNNPYLGANYYFFNRSKMVYCYLGGRAGAVFGNLYPVVTVFDYLGGAPQAVGLSGWNLAAGLGLGYLLGVVDLRLSIWYNAKMLHMDERVYTDLGQSFNLGLVEFNGSLGVKF